MIEWSPRARTREPKANPRVAPKASRKEKEKQKMVKARENPLTKKALRETSMHRMTDPRAKGKEIPKHVLFAGDKGI